MYPRERRACARHAAEGRGTIAWGESTSSSGILLDISAGGACLRLRNPPHVGEHVSLELHNPYRQAHMRVAAQVAHTTPDKDGWFRVGCSFDTQVISFW